MAFFVGHVFAVIPKQSIALCPPANRISCATEWAGHILIVEVNVAVVVARISVMQAAVNADTVGVSACAKLISLVVAHAVLLGALPALV